MYYFCMDAEQALLLSRTREKAKSGAARKLRRTKDLSLPEVAEVVGVSSPTISRWESGTCSPKGEAALRYGRFLELLERSA